jgi:hypothetical protein
VDARVRSAIKPSKGRLDLLWGPTMYHLEDLPYKEGCTDLPDVFTPFRWVGLAAGGRCVSLAHHPLLQLCILDATRLGSASCTGACTASVRTPKVAAYTSLCPPTPTLTRREKVEKGCEVRKELPSPKAGELPLPAADKLPAGSLGALPAWADLPWPASQAPALPAKAHPSSVLDFKGGETVALAR